MSLLSFESRPYQGSDADRHIHASNSDNSHYDRGVFQIIIEELQPDAVPVIRLREISSTDGATLAEQHSLEHAWFSREDIARGVQWRKEARHDWVVYSRLRIQKSAFFAASALASTPYESRLPRIRLVAPQYHQRMTEVIDLLLERLWPGHDVHVESLPGGITNANYLVSFGTQRLVLRVAGENTELLGIDRRGETAANILASSLGVAPEVHARSEHEGWMVTEFLPGRPISLDEMASVEMLSRVATTLRRIHAAGTIDASFDPFSIIRRYHEIARAHDVDEPFDFTAALSVLDRIGNVRPFRPSAFCHNDLLNGNFLYDGEVRILDWEYAGMGDPFFDLANFSANHEFLRGSDVALLTCYFGRADDSLLALLALMKLVSELREAMWGVVQLAVSTLDVDFGAYCEDRSQRYGELLRAMDFDELLHSASALPGDETGFGVHLD